MSSPSSQEQVETKSYLTKMFEIVGVKGVILTLALLGITIVASADQVSVLTSAETGAGLTVLLGLGVLVERFYGPEKSWDRVGIGLVLVAGAYTYLQASSAFPVDYRFAGASGVFLLGTVIYDYWKNHAKSLEEEMSEGRELEGEKQKELMDIDLVGFLTSEIFVIYALLHYGGYFGFIHTPIFPAVIFIFGISIFAVASGYRVISPEVVVSGPSEELHKNIIGILRDLRDLEDEQLRMDIAAKIRLISDGMEGLTVPSDIEDQHGRIPIMLPTKTPSVVYDEISSEGLLEDLKQRRFTGFIVDDDSKVALFRNGRHVKYCLGGNDFMDDVETLKQELSGIDIRAYELGHAVLNELEAVTPEPPHEEEKKKEEEEEEVEELKEKLEEEQKKQEEGESATLNVGGDEINVEEMFEKADEILDELNE